MRTIKAHLEIIRTDHRTSVVVHYPHKPSREIFSVSLLTHEGVWEAVVSELHTAKFSSKEKVIGAEAALTIVQNYVMELQSALTLAKNLANADANDVPACKTITRIASVIVKFEDDKDTKGLHGGDFASISSKGRIKTRWAAHMKGLYKGEKKNKFAEQHKALKAVAQHFVKQRKAYQEMFIANQKREKGEYDAM